MSFFHGHYRYRCNFGPKDKSDIVLDDMQALLKSTQKKTKQKMLQKKKQGKKVVPEYESFPVTKSTRPKATPGLSIPPL